MLVLPSGRVVDISSDRARIHAAQREQRVTEATPHHQLYPLIDVLTERPDGPGSHCGTSRYGFSGHTLADRPWLNRWEARDRTAFLDWLRESSQVSTIEMARRRLLAEKVVPRERLYDYPKRLYSLLQRRVEALPLRRATAEQWRCTLRNLRQEGVRRDELDWSGVLAFLDRRPRGELVDKASVLAAIDFSAIQPRLSSELECRQGCRLHLNETAKRLAGYELQLAGYPVGAGDVAVIRYRSERPAYRVGVLRPTGRTLHRTQPSRWFVLGPYGEAVSGPNGEAHLLFASADEAIEATNRHARRSHRLRCDISHSTRYEYMTLHGGENYREWLVTLPDYHPSHFGGHFHARNILLHIRTKERTTREGQRVLFIEELQSDWCQAIARHGTHSGIPMAPFRREWVTLALKLMLLHVAETGLDGLAWADAEVHQMRYDKPLPALARLYDQEMPRVLNRLVKPWRLEVGRGAFETRRPWLHAARGEGGWKVEGGGGRFVTQPRYSQPEAVALIARHSRAVTLELPVLLVSDAVCGQLVRKGMPMFGERMDGGGY